MGNAHGGVGGIHTLSTMSGRAIDINTYVSIFDFDIKVFVDFWQYDYFSGRCMDASIGFCNWNSLDTMRTAFVFQAAIRPLAFYLKGNIFDTVLGSFVDIKNFDLPVPIVSIATVHAKKLSSEKRCLVTTSASLDGDNSVFLIHAIFGQQGNFNLFE